MKDTLLKVVDEGLRLRADYVDVRTEKRSQNRIVIVNGDVRNIDSNTLSGACIRVKIGGVWGLSSCSMMNPENMLNALEKAVKVAKAASKKGKAEFSLPELKSFEEKVKARVKIDPTMVPVDEKIGIALSVDDVQRGYDRRIVNSNVAYEDGKLETCFCNSIGSYIESEEIRTIIYCYSIGLGRGKRQMGINVYGGTTGFEGIKHLNIHKLGTKSADLAVKMLKAEKPPLGEMDIVVDPEIAGVIAHESFGHAAEADEVVRKRSFLTSLKGKKIASDNVTIIDDATVPNAYGSFFFDSEGVLGQRTTLVKDGVLESYMHSIETAGRLGTSPTGNGRAQDYSRRVFVRMRNTFFEAGTWQLDEMLEDVNNGLYVEGVRQGMEDPVGGGFYVEGRRSYLIENGERTKLCRGVSLSGRALDILKRIDAVGKDVKLQPGHCGKGEEDWVPVSTGGPNLRIRRVIVGGA